MPSLLSLIRCTIALVVAQSEVALLTKQSSQLSDRLKEETDAHEIDVAKLKVGCTPFLLLLTQAFPSSSWCRYAKLGR